MRIVFAGTAPFAVPALEALVAAGHRVELVVTQPDRPGHRGRLTSPAVKHSALRLGLEIAQPERIREAQSVERLRALAPDLLVVAAYGQILPTSVLETAGVAPVNVHASLLPRWRGAAPIAHAILAGDPATGITILQMDSELDHGPILAQAETSIEADEDAAALTARLAVLGGDLLVATIASWRSLEPRAQDHAAATFAGRLKRADGDLEWSLDAAEIDRHVRAFQPWPGVTLPLGEGRLKVLRGRPTSGSGSPGEVLGRSAAGVEVACGRGSYLLELVQAPGRRAMRAALLTSVMTGA
ncbi:MAG: methionyl-tRNA formyltransferase [Candidatus Dormibacteraeota bacterium]|nr:methionyl-tRNA formyltransferase [Candidatus Dormibacteraeota bacterium]